MALLVTSFSVSGRVAAQNPSKKSEADAQEIYLSFNYSGLVSTVITALYYHDSVYLPVGAIFKDLKVDVKIDPNAKTIRGFYINQGNTYAIDFAYGTARIGKKEMKFDTSEAVVGKLDFYILPSLFKEIFDLNFSVDFSSLTLALHTNQELPVVRDYQRAERRGYLVASPQAALVQAPLLFPRTRQLLNGGVLDYSLSAFRDSRQTAYNYSLTGGAELLGGDAEGTVMGSLSRSNSNIYSSDLSWRYAFDSTNCISYAGLGNLYSGGLTQYGFRGAQISNEPVATRTLFSKYEVDAKTNPNWDVELYLNGQLVGYAKADAQGNAHFTIPLVYGTSFIQMKYYGPNGQYNETDRRIQIPYTFIPTGEVDYTISGGKLNNTNYNFLSGDVIVGLTDWMTDKVGMDYVDSPFYPKPLLYNSVSLRLSPEYMLSLDAAPSAYYRSTFNALYASQAAFDLTYTDYNYNLLYNPGDKLQEAQGDIYIPFSIWNSSFNVRTAGTAQHYANGEEVYSYSAYASANLAQLNTSIGYLGSYLNYGNGSNVQSYSLIGSLLYSLSFQPGALDFLNGSLIDATVRYGVLKNSLDDIRFDISQNIQQYVRVDIAAERDFVNKFTSFSLQIVADFPFTRSTASAMTQAGSGSYTENLSGSVGFDSNYRRFAFNDVGWVGRSAASIRMFVDANGNGKYDNGEEVIKNGVVKMRQAVSSQTSGDGIIREWDLLPYTQYSADIEIGSIQNPLWVPKLKSFSFVTDPNSYKRIDIPFFVGGIVDGTVLALRGTSEVAVPGLSLEIRSLSTHLKKTLTVFNDGSFYYMGLPPGEYEAYVDSSQLAMLDVYSDPKVLTFTVKPTKNGGFAEGLRILLRKEKAAATEKVTEKPPIRTSTAPPKEPVAVAISRKYVVQIGAFSNRDRAVSFAQQAEAKTGQEINVRFNAMSGLYDVQTNMFETKQTALDNLDLFINQFKYPDAFIVPTTNPKYNYLFSIQLAAFQSLSAAREYSDEVRRETGKLPLVQFRRSTRLFSVMIGPFANREQSEEVADTLKRIPAYSNVFVTIYGVAESPRMFTVLLGSFSVHESAASFAETFREQTGLTALVDFDSKEMRFNVITQTLHTETEAAAILDRIHSYKGYTSARVIVIP